MPVAASRLIASQNWCDGKNASSIRECIREENLWLLPGEPCSYIQVCCKTSLCAMQELVMTEGRNMPDGRMIACLALRRVGGIHIC